jgi:hypothetical protein
MMSLLESDAARPRPTRKIMPAIPAHGSKNDQNPNLEKLISPTGTGDMVYFLL